MGRRTSAPRRGATRAPKWADPLRGIAIVVRGPLGVGKTTVARRLAEAMGGEYVSIDRILEDEDLWSQGRVREFLGANAVAVRQARRAFRRGRPVVLDGNFYWKAQLRDLIDHLDPPPLVFTLEAPLSTCIQRDAQRSPPHGADAARAVFARSTRSAWGIAVDARPPPAAVVRTLLAHLRRAAGRPAPGRVAAATASVGRPASR